MADMFARSFIPCILAVVHAHQLGEVVHNPLGAKLQNASSLMMTSALMKSGIGSPPDTTCYCRKTSLDCLHVKFSSDDQVETFIACVTGNAGQQGSSGTGNPNPIGSDAEGLAVTDGWCISESDYNKANGDSDGCGMGLTADCDTTSCMVMDATQSSGSDSNDGSLNGLTQGYDTPETPAVRFPESCVGKEYKADLPDACGNHGNGHVYDEHHNAMLLSKKEAQTFLKAEPDTKSPEEEATEEESDATEEAPEDLSSNLASKKPKVVQTSQFIKPEPMVQGDSGYDDEIDAFKQKYGYDDTY